MPRAISGRRGGINPGTPRNGHPRERFLAGGEELIPEHPGKRTPESDSWPARGGLIPEHPGKGTAESDFWPAAELIPGRCMVIIRNPGQLTRLDNLSPFSPISDLPRNPGARRRQPRRLKTIQDPILVSLESEWNSGAARWNSPRISLAGWRERHPGFRCIFPTPRGSIFSPGRRFAPPRL